MPGTPRPLLAVRLIGPAATVAQQKQHLLTLLTEQHGDRVSIRSSTHSARHAGEIRVYVTATLKEHYDHTTTEGGTLGHPPDC
ncbi:hypothetical protein [Actinoplanes sp. NBRC 103695]|uniref:hypothetical protein n=1 Tax=Actinoplanes sp. NBRC 103695 TaxID=3032202 RepID=UPI00249FDE31|nr:hypothetical protein [Actinoplanes sp. NBRC 103695]GLZ00575.1 hypothetical protein Acsp02_78270 [Actinoplanes sp. NBRC 103695]